MVDMAQADRTLRYVPQIETDHIHEAHRLRMDSLREMSDEAYWAFIRGEIQ